MCLGFSIHWRSEDCVEFIRYLCACVLAAYTGIMMTVEFIRYLCVFTPSALSTSLLLSTGGHGVQDYHGQHLTASRVRSSTLVRSATEEVCLSKNGLNDTPPLVKISSATKANSRVDLLFICSVHMNTAIASNGPTHRRVLLQFVCKLCTERRVISLTEMICRRLKMKCPSLSAGGLCFVALVSSVR